MHLAIFVFFVLCIFYHVIVTYKLLLMVTGDILRRVEIGRSVSERSGRVLRLRCYA